mgnify:CR=1 FL=1
MYIYKKIDGKSLVATLEQPENNDPCKVIFMNYKNKNKVLIIKNFLETYKFYRMATSSEEFEYYNELR